MDNETLLFIDTEFTSLNQQGSLISLGMLASDGSSFYAEFSDYEAQDLNDWIKQNVLVHLQFTEQPDGFKEIKDQMHWKLKGNKDFIQTELRQYLTRFEKVVCWLDYVAYDWVFFCELFGGSMNLPPELYYIPFDLPTLFRIKGVDPDETRKDFLAHEIAALESPPQAHHALADAKLTAMAYHKLMSL